MAFLTNTRTGISNISVERMLCTYIHTYSPDSPVSQNTPNSVLSCQLGMITLELNECRQLIQKKYDNCSTKTEGIMLIKAKTFLVYTSKSNTWYQQLRNETRTLVRRNHNTALWLSSVCSAARHIMSTRQNE